MGGLFIFLANKNNLGKFAKDNPESDNRMEVKKTGVLPGPMKPISPQPAFEKNEKWGGTSQH